MEQEVRQLQAEMQKMQLELARLEASRTTSRAWIVAAAGLVCAWLGVNNFYLIPREVDKQVMKGAVGKTAAAIEAKKNEAEADAKEIKVALGSANNSATEAQQLLANMRLARFGSVRFAEATVSDYDWWVRTNSAGNELVFGKGADHEDAGILFTITKDGALLNRSRQPLVPQ